MKNQVQKKNDQKDKKRESPFKLSDEDLRDLYLDTRELPESLKQDMYAWSSDRRLKNYVDRKLFQLLLNSKEGLLEKSAVISVQIIDNLLTQKSPYVWIESYLNFLVRNKKTIKEKLSNQDANRLFKYIPPELVIDYLNLYEIPLTQKEQLRLIEQLTSMKSESILQRLFLLAKSLSKKHKDAEQIIKQLISKNKYKQAGIIIKKLKISKNKYPQVRQALIDNSARTMPYWHKDDYSWERLEEVFNIYPSATAACIKSQLGGRRKKPGDIEQGYASIVKRNPKIQDYLPNPLKKMLAQKINQNPKCYRENSLRTDKFEPSKPQFISFSDYGLSQKDITIVNVDNFQAAAQQLCKSTLWGIDTESTVPRCTLDTDYELLSTIQISTQNKVFVFDAKQLKKQEAHSQAIDSFLTNKEMMIIGHTLGGDLNGSVTSILGFNGQIKCRAIDVVPTFKKAYPDKRPGLKYICEQLLGKSLCKEYTLTDWDRRPLLKNQIHYAALDAFIVLKIWEKLKDKYVPNQVEPQKKKKSKQEITQSEPKEQIRQSETKEETAQS